MQNLMTGIYTKKLKTTDQISNCNIIQLFPKIVKKSGKLGVVCRILEKEAYVVVLEGKLNFYKNKQ